jgi:putative Mn2+ efflux pump MntP
MSDAILPVGLLLGLDSLLVGAALGPSTRTRTYRWALAGAFGVCDGLASLLGSWLAPRDAAPGPWCEWAGTLAVGAYGCFLLFLALWGRDALAASPGGRARWLPFLLPVALSLDNLVVGIDGGGVVSPSPATAVILGVLSGALAAAGLGLGAFLSRLAPGRSGWLAGCALLLVSGVLCFRAMAS